jgi:hypothetical protein
MPPKRFCSLVGEFEELTHKGERIWLRERGLGTLAIKALDWHYFNKADPEPFCCPMPRCNVNFNKAGQWTQHAAETHSTELVLKSQFDILPTALRSRFEERKNSLEQEVEAARRKWAEIYDSWNEEGGEKRRELERGWIHQLENDKAWETEAKGAESKLWRQFTMYMDPTWVGQ